jgi:WD40 repeat protein
MATGDAGGGGSAAGGTGVGGRGAGGTGAAGTGAAGNGADAGGTATGISCPAVEPEAPAKMTVVPPARRPTGVPFSCQPMPSAFIFSKPPAGTPGRFHRCASFDVGAAKQLALSPDGGRVALVAGDGIARVVDVATREVVGVLARPRSTIDVAAFSPDGRAILTLASGEREVTLWDAGTFGAVWTTQLTGRRYQLRANGGSVAFAPDGRAAVVSPGEDAFLLDAATGAVRASRPAKGALARIGYGWGGRRIVAADMATVSDCAFAPGGGSVTILDAQTLADVVRIADLGARFDARGEGGPTDFAASPTDDLVFAPASVGEPPGVRAFRLSDGTPSAAPVPAALPVAFTADGARLLLRASGQLSVVDGADGATIASIADDGSSPVAASADGGTIAIGGHGANLIRVWDVAGAAPTAICASDDTAAGPPFYGTPGVSLNADGSVIALGRGQEVRLVYTADGSSPHTFALDDASQAATVTLSPTLHYVAVGPNTRTGFSTIVFSLQDGGRVAELPSDGTQWFDFVFSPGEETLYAIAQRMNNDNLLYAASLGAPGLTLNDAFTEGTVLLGFSQGCPVVYQSSRGPFRLCGGCADAPVSETGGRPVLSPDGRLLAMSGAYPDPSMTVRSMQPGGALLATFTPSPDDVAYQPLQEVPIAVAASGGRVVSTTIPLYDCYRGPGLAVRIRDLATGTAIDTLPPPPQYAGAGMAVDRDAHTLAYGAQLWCDF